MQPELRIHSRMLLLNPDRLDVGELANAECSKFAAEARPFDASERYARIRCHHLVDEDHSRFKSVDELILLGWVLSPGAGTQTESRVVGDIYGFLGIAYAKKRSYRAKELFAVGGGTFRNIR